MTVNQLPSWVKHMLKNLPGYQASTFSSKWLMPDEAGWFVPNAKKSVCLLIPALENLEVIENQ